MRILIFLIIVSLLVAGFFLFLFIWSVKKGQFDDDYTPALRILNDDELTQQPQKSSEK